MFFLLLNFQKLFERNVKVFLWNKTVPVLGGFPFSVRIRYLLFTGWLLVLNTEKRMPRPNESGNTLGRTLGLLLAM
jgi:hypothetical protein